MPEKLQDFSGVLSRDSRAIPLRLVRSLTGDVRHEIPQAIPLNSPLSARRNSTHAPHLSMRRLISAQARRARRDERNPDDNSNNSCCLLYTSDAADEEDS